MQPLPSSSVYGVPLLCWSPGGVLLGQLLSRVLECLQRASVVLVAWRDAVRAAPAATGRVSTTCCCCAGRELLPGLLEQLARADPATKLITWCTGANHPSQAGASGLRSRSPDCAPVPPKHTGDDFWQGSETRHPTYVDCTKQQTIFVEQIFFTRLFFPVCKYRNQYLYFSPTKNLVLSVSLAKK